jgi:ABC-type uncharacterized transport system auxiliary subunit
VQTRRIQLAALVFLIAGTLAGCGAARPVKYYVIDAGFAPATPPSNALPIVLLVSRVSSSSLYRDDRLVYGSGPVQLGTYEYERWATSPAEMMQNLLVTSLRSTGNYRSVSKIASNVRGDYLVRGNLSALSEVDAPALAARFSFQLELFDPKTGVTVWSDSYSHDEPVVSSAKKPKVTDVILAMDQNVRAGLTQLSASLGQYFANHPPPAATR